MTGQDFLEKYPIEQYSSRMMKIIMNDKYFLTLSSDEYQFLNDLNLIGSDDPEYESILLQYLKNGMIDFFNGCPTEVDEYFLKYLQEDEKDIETLTKKIKRYTKEMQDEIKSSDNKETNIDDINR